MASSIIMATLHHKLYADLSRINSPPPAAHVVLCRDTRHVKLCIFGFGGCHGGMPFFVIPRYRHAAPKEQRVSRRAWEKASSISACLLISSSVSHCLLGFTAASYSHVLLTQKVAQARNRTTLFSREPVVVV